MSIIQFIILLSVVLVWWRLFARWRSGELRISEFLEWWGLWLVISLVTLLPDTASYLANLVGVGRGSDLVTYVALLLIFYLLLKLFIRLDTLEQKIIILIRELALTKKNIEDKS